MTTATAALAPVVDALVREPVADWCVSELQAFLAELVPQVQRLDGLVSLVSGQLQGVLLVVCAVVISVWRWSGRRTSCRCCRRSGLPDRSPTAVGRPLR